MQILEDPSNNDIRSTLIQLFRLQEEQGKRFDARFAAIDDKFVAIDEKFSALDKRMDDLDKFVALDKKVGDLDYKFEVY